MRLHLQIITIVFTSLALAACQTSLEQQVKVTQVQSIDYAGKDIEAGLGILLSANSKVRLGRRMTANDIKFACKQTNKALETSAEHSVLAWQNPLNLHSGQVEITATEGDNATSSVCRRFTHTLEINGRVEKVMGKACRNMWNPNSKWLLAAAND